MGAFLALLKLWAMLLLLLVFGPTHWRIMIMSSAVIYSIPNNVHGFTTESVQRTALFDNIKVAPCWIMMTSLNNDDTWL